MEDNLKNNNVIDKAKAKLGFISNILKNIKPKLVLVDKKIEYLIPNIKIRKILYTTLVSLFGFMFFLIFLKLIISPFSKRDNSQGFNLNKPQISTLPLPSATKMRDDQKKLLDLKNRIKDLRFPESMLTLPIIENNLNI